jgi:signal peptide peptidase SppA
VNELFGMSGMRDKAILAGLLDNYWAMEPQILSRLSEVILRHADGAKLADAEIAAIVAARPDGGRTITEMQRRGRTAILPISGVLVKHSYLVNGDSQPRGTSTLDARAKLDAAMADTTIERIVMLIDSPGGSVFGIADLADAIRKADAIKPVTAMIEDIGASAAYWLASQARAVYVNATAMAGSIGVYTVMVDSSRRADREGLRVELVRAGQHKGIGTAGAPITSGDRQIVQDEVDALYEHFINAVASGRGMSGDAVRALADGRVHIGQAAVDLGLADGVTTLDDLLAALEADQTTKGRMKSSGGPGGPASRDAKKTPIPKTVSASRDNKERHMDDETTAPPAKIEAADTETIRLAAVKDANAAAAQRTRDLAAVLGNRTELLTVCIADGLDVTGAKARLADVLTAENKSLTEQLAAANTKTGEIAAELASLKGLAAKAGITPLKLAGAADDPASGNAGAYEGRVAEQIAAGAKPARARIEASKQFPAEHKAWIAAQQPAKK